MFQVVVKSFCRCLNEPIQYASKAQLHKLHICTLVVRKIYTFCSLNNFFGKFYLNPKIGITKEVEKSLKSNCLTRTNKKKKIILHELKSYFEIHVPSVV